MQDPSAGGLNACRQAIKQHQNRQAALRRAEKSKEALVERGLPIRKMDTSSDEAWNQEIALLQVRERDHDRGYRPA